MTLTLDTAFEKRISARLESAEQGTAAIGPALVGEVAAPPRPVARHLPLEPLERPVAPGGDIGTRELDADDSDQVDSCHRCGNDGRNERTADRG
jgi:hypothetical protein